MPRLSAENISALAAAPQAALPQQTARRLLRTQKKDISIAYAVLSGARTETVAVIGIYFFVEQATVIKTYSLLLVIVAHQALAIFLKEKI